MRAAKLVWNNDGWTLPAGSANYGVLVNGPNFNNYRYGLEEFLFNDQLIQRNLGYLDCYRNPRNPRFNQIEDVLLFTLNPNDGHILAVGVLRVVNQLLDNEKIQIWNDMQQHNYIENVVNPAFQIIEFLDNNEQAIGTGVYFANNFGVDIDNLPLIHGIAPNGFFVNLRYKGIEIFPADEWIDLTNVDPGVNNAWRHLSTRYHIGNRPLIEAELVRIGLL
jgi:hypothetical protein